MSIEYHKNSEFIPFRSRNNCNKAPKSFTQQEIDFQSTPLFIPEGMEKPFILVYFILLPYIFGLLFLYIYIAESNLELFSSVYQHSSFLLTWSIGYEILASLVMLYIIKMAFGFSKDAVMGNKPFVRPH